VLHRKYNQQDAKLMKTGKIFWLEWLMKKEYQNRFYSIEQMDSETEEDFAKV
jgi:hypothetical protein